MKDTAFMIISLVVLVFMLIQFSIYLQALDIKRELIKIHRVLE